jgi:PAS domain S-box-containing protein
MIGKTKLLKSASTGKLRLRTTLVIPFVLQVVSAVGLVGYLSFRNGQRAVNDLANQLNGEISTRIEQHVVSYLNKSQDTLWLTYAGVQSQSFDLNDFEGLRRYFWQVVHKGNFEEYLGYGNEQGGFVGIEAQEGETPQLKIRTLASEPLREVYLLDDQGERKTQLKATPYDPRTRPWYKAAQQAGKPTWSKIYPFFSSQNTVLGISPAHPLYDDRGTLLGVLCINVRLTQITDFMNHLFISPNGQSFIMERSGDLVASSKIPQPFKVKGEGDDREIERIPAIESDNSVVKATAQHLVARSGGLQSIQHGESLKFQANGAWHYAQVRPIQDGRGIDWLTVVVVPEQDFMEQINQNTRNSILLCLAAFGTAIAIGILTARWVTRPILRVSQASDKLAQGELDQQVEPSSITEINTLANSFNLMAKQLNESFESLRIAEENYRSIFENALEGIFQSSPSGKFIRANRALADIYGYDSPAEMIESITDISEQLYVDPEKRAEFRNQLEQHGAIEGFEHRCYCKDSSIIWTQLDARVVKDNSGNVLYYEGMVQDITERKRQEAELRRQLEELKVEIDQKKREKEVAMLTQSSYFQEVQQEIAEVNLDEFWS